MSSGSGWRVVVPVSVEGKSTVEDMRRAVDVVAGLGGGVVVLRGVVEFIGGAVIDGRAKNGVVVTVEGEGKIRKSGARVEYVGMEPRLPESEDINLESL